MSKITIGNLKKAYYYLKRNGLRDTFPAALERLHNKNNNYCYEMPSGQELHRQRHCQWKHPVKFTLLVPAFRTPEIYLRELIESLLNQTYSCFELMIGDASGDNSVEAVTASYADERIKYVRLKENGGISANTNAVLELASGDYTGLLDHDDVLTPDALYHMALKIEQAYEKGQDAKILYSDEDKCDETGQNFYEPHFKTEFNLDLILSNNYICHFLVMETEFLRSLGFRKEFDGAQDYDLVLRGAARLLQAQPRKPVTPQEAGGEKSGMSVPGILHIPRVLYHWRCHSASTAANPQSKMYAYEAGGRAIDDFLMQMGWRGHAVPLKHLGFYRVIYEEGILKARGDVGIYGGKLLGRNKKITGGIYDENGNCPYAGLQAAYSGYMHRAALQQEAFAVDIRLMELRPELEPLFAEVTGWKYGEKDIHSMPADTDWAGLSMELCRRIWLEGYRVVWEPEWKGRISE